MAPSTSLQHAASGRDAFGAQQTNFENEVKQRRKLLGSGSRSNGRRSNGNRIGRGENEEDGTGAHQRRQLFDPLGRLDRLQAGASKALNNLLNPTRQASPESTASVPPEPQPAPTSTAENPAPVQPTTAPVPVPVQPTTVPPPAAAPATTQAPQPVNPPEITQPPQQETLPATTPTVLLPTFIVCIIPSTVVW